MTSHISGSIFKEICPVFVSLIFIAYRLFAKQADLGAFVRHSAVSGALVLRLVDLSGRSGRLQGRHGVEIGGGDSGASTAAHQKCYEAQYENADGEVSADVVGFLPHALCHGAFFGLLTHGYGGFCYQNLSFSASPAVLLGVLIERFSGVVLVIDRCPGHFVLFDQHVAAFSAGIMPGEQRAVFIVVIPVGQPAGVLGGLKDELVMRLPVALSFLLRFSIVHCGIAVLVI
jgi:hypothetical protein